MELPPPAPVPAPPPQQEEEGEYLPIFASVESSWFTKPAQTQDRREPSWSSPADNGWQAAGAVSEPSLGGTTTSGLPKRTPRANLVPGTASQPAVAAPAPLPAPPPSPDRLRSRLASYQQGVRKGRAELEEDA
jgi:hypothetical protein